MEASLVLAETPWSPGGQALCPVCLGAAGRQPLTWSLESLQALRPHAMEARGGETRFVSLEEEREG